MTQQSKRRAAIQLKSGNRSVSIVSKDGDDSDNRVACQVEFYFSESNLLTDKFLFGKVEGHKNQPVPIDIIHSFKRMRRYQPRSAVVAALKDSTVLEIVDDDSAIKRKQPLPENLAGKEMDEIAKVQETASMARSIYAKGFGEEQSQTQFEIEAFFANYGPTNSVRLRRRDDGGFKGSVFVEFDSESTQKSFLEIIPAPKWNGKDLQIKSKKDYCDEKLEDIKAGRIPPKRHGGRNDRNHGKSASHDKNGNARNWNERREEDRKLGFKDSRTGKYQGHGKGQGRGRRWEDRNEERRTKKKDSGSVTAHCIHLLLVAMSQN